MTTVDEDRIRTMIERWAAAVHAGDMAGVHADHAEDIVMFDVPPPENGVCGLDAYRATWPDFFRWQASGGMFELDTLEITAGGEVAFATALLRCGPGDRRLRLTLGLRKEHGRWLVAHEHHSFTQPVEETAEAEVRAVHQQWFDATARKDLDQLMAHIADDVVSYEHDAPLRNVGVDAATAGKWSTSTSPFPTTRRPAPLQPTSARKPAPQASSRGHFRARRHLDRPCTERRFRCIETGSTDDLGA